VPAQVTLESGPASFIIQRRRLEAHTIPGSAPSATGVAAARRRELRSAVRPGHRDRLGVHRNLGTKKNSGLHRAEMGENGEDAPVVVFAFRHVQFV
jgi:hypothetical protein